MDESLTNLMNNSQNTEITYKINLQINESYRENIKLVFIIIHFILNTILLFSNNIVLNIILFLIGLFCFLISGLSIIKNYDYFKNNKILLFVFILSIIFESIIIFNNNTNIINKISLFLTIFYQSLYMLNFE